ncbi:hypothetical protein DRP07_10285 [Archaeoglobales archaeon]|nr:MAG: hypothetical protein DRP07_10285 [Archaeoglobales archaeon]
MQNVTTPPAIGETMAKLIPNSDIKMVSNLAHLAKIENPEEFNRYVVEFLMGLEGLTKGETSQTIALGKDEIYNTSLQINIHSSHYLYGSSKVHLPS